MGIENTKKDINDKFNEAVDDGITGGGDDEELDSFLEESFTGKQPENPADFEEDLGYVIESPEASEEEETEEEEEIEEEETEEEESEEEVEEETEEETEEEEVEEEETEEEEDSEEEEGEDEETFYDSERDFEGEDVPPSLYKDRMSLNHGLVAKASYFKTLNERLEKAGTDIGALSLPKLANDPDALNQYTDIEQVIGLPDDQAKEFVKDMDVLLRNMKNKAERHEELQKQENQEKELSQEYLAAQQTASDATRLLGLKVTKDMTDKQVLDMAYDRLEEFEADEDKSEELGHKEYLAELRKMEDAVFALEDFAKIAAKREEVLSSKKKTETKVTPDQIKASFNEFMQDQPGLDMVKNNRVEMQKSLIQTAIRKGWNVSTPRDWLQNYEKFMDIVNSNRAKKGLKELKDDSDKTKKKGKAKKTGKKTGRAKKYANKKPSKSGSVTYSNRTGNKAIDDLDDELDELALELVSSVDDSDNEFEF